MQGMKPIGPKSFHDEETTTKQESEDIQKKVHTLLMLIQRADTFKKETSKGYHYIISIPKWHDILQAVEELKQ